MYILNICNLKGCACTRSAFWTSFWCWMLRNFLFKNSLFKTPINQFIGGFCHFWKRWGFGSGTHAWVSHPDLHRGPETHQPRSTQRGLEGRSGVWRWKGWRMEMGQLHNKRCHKKAACKYNKETWISEKNAGFIIFWTFLCIQLTSTDLWSIQVLGSWTSWRS